MDYRALIQNRKSVREFSRKSVPASAVAEIEAYHKDACQRLLPGLKTELRVFGDGVKAALEGSAGYQDFLVGAPNYLVLLSARDEHAGENAGYIMEDLILKLTDLDLDSCWLTFTDSERVKQALGIASDLDVAAVAAFGRGVKAARRLRVNILSMSNLDIKAKRQYFAPKKGINDMVFMDAWGMRDGLDAYIGFYNDILWESLYAATLAPSYLNRQPYGFVIHDRNITLVQEADPYTPACDGKLGLGVVLLHFAGVASQWAGGIAWKLGQDAAKPELPAGCTAVASCRL